MALPAARLGGDSWAAVLLAGAVFALPAAALQEWVLSAEELDQLDRGEVIVDAYVHGGSSMSDVRAAVRIHAPPERVFRTMTDCEQALEFVPHLEHCAVLDEADDGSWQIVEQEVDYGWYMPRTHYVFRAEYTPFESVRFEHVRGDFRQNEGVWELLPIDGGVATIVTYRVHVEPRFYVPRWLMRATLRRDLPDLMRALRARCESQ